MQSAVIESGDSMQRFIVHYILLTLFPHNRIVERRALYTLKIRYMHWNYEIMWGWFIVSDLLDITFDIH